MQDDNTIQPADINTDASSSDDNGPALSLGTNPSAQADTPDQSTATPTTDAGVETPPETTTDDNSPPDTSSVSPEPVDTTPLPSVPSGDLDSIKASVLQELVPIVSELDQPPEDKYRTLMMLIQSSDNQDLIKDAYEAAHQIEDKKAKAEALLNIVNEINYFTGKGTEKSEG